MTDSQSIRTKKIKICELVIKFIKHKSVCGLGSSKLKRIMHISYVLTKKNKVKQYTLLFGLLCLLTVNFVDINRTQDCF